MKMLGGSLRSKSNVNISVQVENKSAQVEARADVQKDSKGNINMRIIVDEIESSIGRNIGRGEGLATTLERRYGLNPAAGSYR